MSVYLIYELFIIRYDNISGEIYEKEVFLDENDELWVGLRY